MKIQITPYHRFQDLIRSSHRRCSVKKLFLKTLRISQEQTCIGTSFLIKLQVWKLFFKNAYFEKHLRATASVISKATVNTKDNGFTITMELYYSFMLYRNSTTNIYFEILQDFVRLFWMEASKVVAKDKSTFSVSIKVTIVSIDVIFICF